MALFISSFYCFPFFLFEFFVFYFGSLFQYEQFVFGYFIFFSAFLTAFSFVFSFYILLPGLWGSILLFSKTFGVGFFSLTYIPVFLPYLQVTFFISYFCFSTAQGFLFILFSLINRWFHLWVLVGFRRFFYLLFILVSCFLIPFDIFFQIFIIFFFIFCFELLVFFSFFIESLLGFTNLKIFF